MIPVMQRQLWRPDDHPDGPQRGDCLRACVASILEIDYLDVPDLMGGYQPLFTWLRRVAPGVHAQHRVLGLGHRETLESWRDWPTEHAEQGYWIAGVYSPRIPDIELFGCGCTARVPGGDLACEWCAGKPEERSMGISWGLHAVVMRGHELAHDPHPESDGTIVRFSGATTFLLTDPAPAVQALWESRHAA